MFRRDETRIGKARKSRAAFYGSFFLTIIAGCAVLAMLPARSPVRGDPVRVMTAMAAADSPPESTQCVEMEDMSGMNVMGQSMAAMMNHMCMTPAREPQPGDEERARAVVAQVKAAITKYKDYKKALGDGFVIANPKLDQPQFHFTNDANVRVADTTFDPTRPSSLLYRRTPTQQYKLEGVMFTARNDATDDDLNRRIPLSVARWHKHTNFCAAPADKVKEYLGAHPKFGMFGSIHTKEACDAEGGVFYPVMFSWMIHVFPYEDNLKDVFSMNDDIAHVH